MTANTPRSVNSGTALREKDRAEVAAHNHDGTETQTVASLFFLVVVYFIDIEGRTQMSMRRGIMNYPICAQLEPRLSQVLMGRLAESRLPGVGCTDSIPI